MITNGVIKEYLIRYFSMGPSVVTTPASFVDASLMLNYSSEIFNDSNIMTDIFDDLQNELTLDAVENMMNMCVYILSNETVQELFETDESVSAKDSVLQNYNLSETVVDWFTNENQTVLQTCDALKTAAQEKAVQNMDKGTAFILSILTP